MNTRLTIGSLTSEAVGKRVTTVCPGLPAWAMCRHEQIGFAFLTTSVVLTQHTVKDVAGGKRLVRRHRRVVVGLS